MFSGTIIQIPKKLLSFSCEWKLPYLGTGFHWPTQFKTKQNLMMENWKWSIVNPSVVRSYPTLSIIQLEPKDIKVGIGIQSPPNSYIQYWYVNSLPWKRQWKRIDFSHLSGDGNPIVSARGWVEDDSHRFQCTSRIFYI